MKVFVSAFAEQIRALGFTVHEGRVDTGVLSASDFPYVVVSAGLQYDFSGNDRYSDSLADVVDAIDMPLRVTCAGLTDDSVGVLQSRVRAEMNRASLTVSGFSPARLKVSPLVATSPDTTVAFDGLNPQYCIDEFRVITSKER